MNSKNTKKYLSKLLILLLTLTFAAPNVVLAEVTRKKLSGIDNIGDFILGPGKTEIFVNPGETVTRTINVTSRVDKRTNFNIGVEDFVGSNDPSQPVVLLGDSESPYSLKNFIKPEVDSFSLDFAERVEIPITISIPADAEPRGYYGAVLISNAPDKVIDPETGQEIEGTTKVISRVGSLFLLRVNGEVEEKGSLVDFKLMGDKKLFYPRKPEGFEIVFENEGNVHLVPYGEISITNLLGKEVARLPADAYFVLPDSTRTRQVLWNDSFFGIGRYKASLSFYKGYGSENNLEEGLVTFWIFPWKIVISVFVTLFVLITIIYYIISRFELKRKN